jgi:hypothetical protein
LILFALMMEAVLSSETAVLATATRHSSRPVHVLSLASFHAHSDSQAKLFTDQVDVRNELWTN